MNDFIQALSVLEKTSTWDDEASYTFIHKGISQLLATDIHLLFQFLYRIDVKESLVKEIFASAEETETLSAKLTQVVIDRLQLKAALRRKYGGNRE